jgi:hypothetical protein
LPRAAIELATRIPAIFSAPPLSWDVGLLTEGGAAEPVALDEATISARLDRLRRHAIPFVLADRSADWAFLLAVQESPVEGVQYADLSLSAAVEPQLAATREAMALVTTMGVALGGHVAYLEDAQLLNLYSGRRANARTLAALPPEVRRQLSPEALADLEGVPVGAGSAGPLPELLLPGELQRDRVPSGVYWLNWWSARLVETLDREVVRRAGWERVVEHADGSMTLAVTDHQVDVNERDDVERLANIIAALDLPAVQQRFVRA